MNRILLILFVITVFATQEISAQFANPSLNKESKGRAIKAAKEQADKYTNQGWRVYNDFMELDMRLQTTWVVENELNDSGESKYLSAEGNAIASSRTDAHLQAVQWAKLRIAREIVFQSIPEIEQIPDDAEKNFLLSEIIDKMPDEVRSTFQILSNIDHDYIFKIAREQNNVHEVAVKLFFERRKIEVFANYATDILAEMQESQLFRPKDEFESNNQYNERKKRAANLEKQIFTKYQQKYLTESREKKEAEEKNKRKRIKESYQKVALRIENIGVYDAEKQTFPITINSKTLDINIPSNKAREFKSNISNIRVMGDKQLGPDGKRYEIFNIKLVEPNTQTTYLFGKQREPMYVESTDGGTPPNLPANNSKNSKFISGQNVTKFLPPMVAIENVKFRDVNNNNRIDALEQIFIDFDVVNNGKGDAFNLVSKIDITGDTIGFKIETEPKALDLQAGMSKKLTIAAKATMDLKRGKVIFRIQFSEKNGFDCDPVEIAINTLEFQKPKVKIVDYKFINQKDESAGIEPGVPVSLKVIIQNIGQGPAETVNAYFVIPKLNVFMINEHNYSIGKLQPGESREITFEFVPNKRYQSNMLPIEVTLSEKYRQFAESSTLSTKVDHTPQNPERFDIISEKYQEKQIEMASLTPDVDQDIPVVAAGKSDTYVLIIGNEDYSSNNTGLSTDVNVNFAENDAKIFKEYAIKTLGIPERNVEMLINANSAKMNQGIAWLNTIAKIYGTQAELILYYAGHGIANEKSKEAFLIPVDVNGIDLKHALKVNDIYAKLGEFQTKRVTVFLDAAFSGGARNRYLIPDGLNEKIVFGGNQVYGNFVEFLACSGDQTAYAYPEKQHGMFTYFLLKKLKETRGSINYKALADYLNETVKNISSENYNYNQTPVINYPEELEEVWKHWRVR